MVKDGEGAYLRYYAKNRDALVARMRERYYARRDKQHSEAEGSPDTAKKQQSERHEKYVRTKQNGALKMLRETADKPILRPTAKRFIEEELIRTETYQRMPLSAVKALCSALEYHKESPVPQSENGCSTTTRINLQETEEGEEEEATEGAEADICD